MKRVSILTHSFVDAYNQRFNKIFGGGLERYLYDLCGVIKAMGMQPEVHQLSYFTPFQTVVEDIKVFGYPYEFDQVAEAFQTMAEQATGALIYASCIWHPIQYKKGSLGICHGLNWDRCDLPTSEKAKVAQAVQTALNQLACIVSVDSHFLSFCRSVCRYADPEQVVLLPNAVDTAHFSPVERTSNGDHIRVLFPRRISHERGVIPMMLAADCLLAAYQNLTIEFAGEMVDDSPICNAFLIWKEEHPHRQRITHRTYSFDQIVEGYRKADIVVIPSIFSEGTSYSCLEAISCGTAVVASNVGGLNDIIINGYNGLLVPPTDEQITLAVKRLIDNPQLRKSIGVHARETSLAFDKSIWEQRWQAILGKYLK